MADGGQVCRVQQDIQARLKWQASIKAARQALDDCMTKPIKEAEGDKFLPFKDHEFQSKPRTCPVCETTYPKGIGHFGVAGTNTNCNSCHRKRTKVCKCCGGAYFGISKHFRRGGKITDTCNACYQEKIKAQNASWWAKRRQA